jgi:hypothetical protein
MRVRASQLQLVQVHLVYAIDGYSPWVPRRILGLIWLRHQKSSGMLEWWKRAKDPLPIRRHRNRQTVQILVRFFRLSSDASMDPKLRQPDPRLSD